MAIARAGETDTQNLNKRSYNNNRQNQSIHLRGLGKRGRQMDRLLEEEMRCERYLACTVPMSSPPTTHHRTTRQTDRQTGVQSQKKLSQLFGGVNTHGFLFVVRYSDQSYLSHSLHSMYDRLGRHLIIASMKRLSLSLYYRLEPNPSHPIPKH